MNKRQINGYEAGKRVQALWNDYATDLGSIPEMADEKDGLDTALDAIESAAAIQSDDLKGEALLKKNLKDTMAMTVVKFAMRARVKARQVHNLSLKQELSHPFSFYSHADSELALSRATATKLKIKNNLTILTNITTANISEMDDAITAFEAVITAQETSKNNQKVTGTDEIADLSTTLNDVVI